MVTFLRIALTEHQTVFEYDDELNDDNIPYHPGYIRISEIELYQQFRHARIQTSNQRLSAILVNLRNAIHSGDYSWLDTETPQYDGMLGLIIGRLACVTNDYNDYEDYIQYLQNTQVPQSDNTYLSDRRFVDDEDYQLRLSHFKDVIWGILG